MLGLFFLSSFQDKPERCSEGSQVNLMTIAISSSRNLFIAASREKPCTAKTKSFSEEQEKREKRHIPRVCLRFYHGPQALVTGTLSCPRL